jgi:hypothetical protein
MILSLPDPAGLRNVLKRNDLGSTISCDVLYGSVSRL